MPWSANDANRFKKNLGPAASRRWAKIANNVLKQSGQEGQAIRVANGATRSRNSAIQRRLKSRGAP